ncbi:hypothetical protein BYT27DRAFT_7212708 [Phlegmacium glaucopus]|nr:hypothetical protein BYT27DRAFT_7212708 [Phlegmacium glaucopus]
MAQNIQYSVTDNDQMMTFSDDPAILDQALPSLILDPAYNFDRPLDLNSSMDPSICPNLLMESLSALTEALVFAPAFNSELCQGLTPSSHWMLALASLALNPQSLSMSQPIQLDPASALVLALITTESLVLAPAQAQALAAVNTTQQLDLLSVHPAVSPRRKGKNAKKLVQEEAQKYGATGKHWC